MTRLDTVTSRHVTFGYVTSFSCQIYGKLALDEQTMQETWSLDMTSLCPTTP